jgi:DNA gyrase inhibitor GyrI
VSEAHTIFGTEDRMTTLQVEIRDVPPMLAVAAHAVSATPEQDAWAKLLPWARAAGLLEHPESHPVFGYNNPPPEPGERAYGYELWIRVEDRPEVPPELRFRRYRGGRFAVTRCRLHRDPHGTVPEVWQKLLAWVQQSPHTWRRAHEMERVCNPGVAEEELELELYLPIED